MVRSIAFDESGNTGEHLLSPEQPVFVLASASLTPEQLSAAETALQSVGASEWKYSKFKRKPGQLKKFLSLMEDPIFGGDSLKAYVIHKPFMIVAKFVDLVHEPIARAYGIDLYERGGALAMANLFTSVLPVYLGETVFSDYLNSFSHCVRDGSMAALAAFERRTHEVKDILAEREPDLAASFAPVILACKHRALWLDHLNRTELDPLVPAYFILVDAWGQQLGERFIVIADESKTVAQEAPLLMKFADKDLAEKTIAGVGGSARYPLLAEKITTASSSESRAIQIADLTAGAINHVFTSMAKRVKLDDTLSRIRDVMFAKHLLVGGMWPSTDVTPESLGADYLTGENAVDYSHKILSGDPTTRRSR